MEIVGTRARIAEVLNGKRGLSISMIRRLHERLGISAEVLIRPTRKSAA
jgi:HTH-type transcriptional regulator / antitoxin HigA